MKTHRLEEQGGYTGRSPITLLAALLSLAVLIAFLAPSAPASAAPAQLWQRCPFGEAAAHCDIPRGIAADPATGHLYVADQSNNRIEEFTAWGEFVKAWGQDVVRHGSPDDVPGATEQQQVTVKATSGTFRLGYEGSDNNLTTPMPFDAPASLLEAELDTIPGIANFGGSVSVSGGPGDAGGSSPYLVTFAGGLQGDDVRALEGLGAGASVTVATTVPGGGNFEVCRAASSPADVCKEGTRAPSAGAIYSAQGIALDSAGDVYVAERGGEPPAPRVQKFSPSGQFLRMWGKGVNSGTSGNPDLCTDAGSPTDVCGAGSQGTANGQFGNWAVGSFIAVAPGDQVWVGDEGRIQRFNAQGEFQSQIALPGETVKALATDSAGSLYVAACQPGASCLFDNPTKPNVRKLSPTGTLLATLSVANPQALATDAAGDLYVFDGGSNPTLRKFDPTGAEVKDAEFPFTTDAVANSTGIAADTVTEAGGIGLYLSNANEQHSFLRAYGAPPLKWPRPVVPPSIDAQYATEATTESATLHARIDPLFWEDTRYYVQYGIGKCSEGACTQAQPASPGSLLTAQIADAGFTTPAVTLSSLTPATVYHYRFVAQSSGGGPVYGIDPDGEGPAQASEAEGAEAAFRTLPLPAAPGTECPNQALRSGASAHLPDCRAYELITPAQKPTGVDYRNIYPVMLATPSGQMLTYAAGNLPSADASSSPSVFQYIASRDPAAGWVDRSIDPPRESLSYDFPVGAAGETPFSAFTPDLCHGFYLQDNGLILAPGAAPGWSDLYTRTDQSCGGAPDYSSLTTTGPGNLTPTFVRYYVPKVLGFSADAQTVVFTANGALTPEADPDPKTESYNYLPSFQLYAAGAGGAERLVSTLPDASPAPIPHASALGWGREFVKGRVRHAVSADGSRVYWREGNSGALYLRINPTQPPSAFQHGAGIGIGNLSDGSPTVSELFAAKGKAAFSAGSPTVTLLETSVGRFLPGLPVSAPGKIPAGTTILSISGSTLTLSANATASSASFSITSKGPQPFAAGQSIAGPGIAPETTIIAASSGSLTLSKPATASATGAALEAFSDCTEAAKACTLPVSGAVSAGQAEFDTASPDGSRAIFRTADKLYEFDATAAIAGEPEPATLIASGVVGFIDASEDASRLYFASTEDLSSGEPEPANPQGDLPLLGQPNLYLYEAGPGGGSFAFIGTLSARDAQDGLFNSNDTYPSPLNPYPERRTSRVSPDGLHAAFSSSASLTGYDNADSASGQADSEAYLYDAAGGGQARLICVSCNPTGARPVGVDLGLGRWSASEVPGWQNGDQPSRALAEDGSYLLFESHDALVPNDTNGRLDVYQWEAPVGEPGDGRCTEASPLYSPANRGCLSLISSGQSGADSRFLDASADGRDVFFFTKASLLDRDPPTGLSDIYDARVNGGFPEPPPPPAACEGEACQSPPEAPNDPTPASSAYQGPGNPEEPPRAKPCPKGKVRRHGRCVAKKHHKRPHRRANPNRRVTR